MKIWLRLHGFEPCSWTTVWQYLGVALRRIGVDVCDITAPDNPEEYVELWWGDPQFFRWSDLPVKSRIALVLSEAHSIRAKGRDRALANLGRADMLICPSEFAATAFRESPLDVPIRLAFFGIEPEEFPFVERSLDGQLKFLHAGVSQFRKGSELVPEAFIMAFDRKDSVQLMMAAPRSSPMFTRLKSEYGSHNNIVFYANREESTAPLYYRNHIYVSPHLSEGFGLMPVEAMATGMSCIMSRCSAPCEYFDKDYGWWAEMSEEYAPVSSCLPDTNGFWRLPDVNSLAEQMREAYDNKDEVERKGRSASEYVHAELTWDLTAEQIVAHIEEVLSEENICRDDRLQRGKLVTGPSGKYYAAC